MAKINRDYVLKTFLDKVREAKRQDMKEVKIPMRFLDDLAYIIVQLMSEELSRAFEAIENKPKEEIKSYIPINKKVLKTITPKKIEEALKSVEVKPVESEVKQDEPVVEEVKPVEEPVKSFEEQPVVYKPKEQPKVEPVIEEQEDEEDDDNTNIMYGGTW